ncbi:MAG: hypothetical protein LBF79_05195 [Dysgonamonadaceae bacterium]|nr:hypothetical protein [Dysgonamonadaceae bacterium]
MILFEDEASLSNTATVSYSWAEKAENQPASAQARTENHFWRSQFAGWKTDCGYGG